MELDPDAPKPERTASSGFMVPLRSGQSLVILLVVSLVSVLQGAQHLEESEA